MQRWQWQHCAQTSTNHPSPGQAENALRNHFRDVHRREPTDEERRASVSRYETATAPRRK